MTINDPTVIAELEGLYPEYEQALVMNDVEKLVAMFWAAGDAFWRKRESLWAGRAGGFQEIAAFSQSCANGEAAEYR
jgi:hypothetical protein